MLSFITICIRFYVLVYNFAQIVSSKPLVTKDGWNSTVLALPVQGGLPPGTALGSVTGDAVCFDNSPLRP